MNEYSSVVTPGWMGFAAFAFLAIMLWLLMRNMVARIRRMKFAEQDRLAALEADQGAASVTEASDAS